MWQIVLVESIVHMPLPELVMDNLIPKPSKAFISRPWSHSVRESVEMRVSNRNIV